MKHLYYSLFYSSFAFHLRERRVVYATRMRVLPPPNDHSNVIPLLLSRRGYPRLRIRKRQKRNQEKRDFFCRISFCQKAWCVQRGPPVVRPICMKLDYASQLEHLGLRRGPTGSLSSSYRGHRLRTLS